MRKLYKLEFENYTFEGIFVDDPDFGFFFFTEKTNTYIRTIKSANLLIENDITVDKTGNEYQANKIKGENYYVYSFCLKDVNKKPKVNSYSLKELSELLKSKRIDEELSQIPFKEIKNKYIVIEEKVDGANTAISFDDQGELLLQSRGHYLTGGYRERHYNLFKQWAMAHKEEFYNVLKMIYLFK